MFVGDGAQRRELTARRIVPVETLIDATDGQVELTFETFEEDAAKYGPYQHGVFQDGAFTIHQGRNDSLVELRLVNEEAEAAAAGAGADGGSAQAPPGVGERDGGVPHERASRGGDGPRHALAHRGAAGGNLLQGDRGRRARGGVPAQPAEAAPRG